jgi:hypothetical protein
MGRRITGKISRSIIDSFAAVKRLIFATSDPEAAPNRPQSSERNEEARKGNPWGNRRRWIKLDGENSKGEGEGKQEKKKGQQS